MNFYEYLENKAKREGIDKIVVGAIITNEKKEIFLVRRNKDDFMGGIFEIPSGKLEKGENILDALIRETKEETNLDLIKIDSYINYFDYFSNSGKKSRQYNFAVQTSGEEIKLTEHDTYKWINLNEIEEEEITSELKECLMIYKFNEFERE